MKRAIRKLKPAKKYPLLACRLNEHRDAPLIESLADFIEATRRSQSDIVAQCVRIALPQIIAGKASAK